MSRLFSRTMIGFLVCMAIVGAILYTQMSKASPTGSALSAPRATIDLTAIKHDLLAIANAERGHYAIEGRYASLEELVAKGNLEKPVPTRGDYIYAAEYGETGFRVTATYSGASASASPRLLAIDQTMQISAE